MDGLQHISFPPQISNKYQSLVKIFVPFLIGLMLLLFCFKILSPVQAIIDDASFFVGIERADTNEIAWGDWDGDGDLDLVVANGGTQANQLYQQNENGFFSLFWNSTELNDSRSIAWGDWDNDGDLDLAVGNRGQPNQIYENEAGSFLLDPPNSQGWISSDAFGTESVAWGDWDNDGDLDLAVGNGQNEPSQLFENNNGTLLQVWQEPVDDIRNSRSVAWGDWDNDGDLDLAQGNLDSPNRVCVNEGTPSIFNCFNIDSSNDQTESIVWGDVNGDGFLDLAVGNRNNANQVCVNNGDLTGFTCQSLGDSGNTFSVDWGDWDRDGDLDLAVGNGTMGQNQIYQNEDGTLSLAWEAEDSEFDTAVIAWSDIDNDGDLDLTAGNKGQENRVYINEGHALTQTTQSLAANTTSAVWGDWDQDGDLELIFGNANAQKNQICEIDKTTNSLSCSDAMFLDGVSTTDIALGDVDSDGDLDLAESIFGGRNRLCLNDILSTPGGDMRQFTCALIGTTAQDENNSREIAWGDWDGDGDLDLAVGNWEQSNQVYENNDGQLILDPSNGWGWQSSEISQTQSIAWGDVDADGDLDLAVGNWADVNQLYQNDGGQLHLVWESLGDIRNTQNIAWGDWNGDGDLDLAVGNWSDLNQVYAYENGRLSLAWQSSGNARDTQHLAWGDWDGDGDLDLAVGNRGQANQVFENQGDTLSRVWESEVVDETFDVAWGDGDGDGDFDLAAANNSGNNVVYQNYLLGGDALGFNAPMGKIQRPEETADAYFFSTAARLEAPILPITFTLFGPEYQRISRIDAFYSLNGGGEWQTAVQTTDTLTTNLSVSPFPTQTVTNTHVFYWDTLASQFFGQSDAVLFRLDVTPITGRYQQAKTTIYSPPFAARGTQVQVFSETIALGNEVPNAFVYRLPDGQFRNAQPMASLTGQPWRTDQNGFLQGRGTLGVGDQLFALLPITSTGTYTLYHTSAQPNELGLEMFEVVQAGKQTLVVSADQPLLIFDLIVSLEWDARNDEQYLTNLENDLKNASKFLYDWTNGQVVLGHIQIYHRQENWRSADIVIQANNSQRPGAILGGIVPDAMDDDSNEISNAYVPGQIRMGPDWTRFGDELDDDTEAWARVLAHELGHYLLFLPDNYLGIKDGHLVLVDCQGSAMTQPYTDDYSEFLSGGSEWVDDCQDTLAAFYLGRDDWETILEFYPMLDSSPRNSGPKDLPLAVTQVSFIDPVDPPNTLADQLFNLRDNNGTAVSLPKGQGEGYLLNRHQTEDLTDDTLVALGSANGEWLLARGAQPDDRLCLYDFSHDPMRLGCIESIGTQPAPIFLQEVDNWSPQITVTTSNSRTFGVTVTNINLTGTEIISAQLHSSLGGSSLPFTLIEGTNGFSQTITLDEGAFSGFMRIWIGDSDPLKEMIFEFNTYQDWGGKSFAWGGKSFAWGGKSFAWGAPVTSSDGQVRIFAVADPFGDETQFTLNVLPELPSLPSWLTPVGRAYKILSDDPLSGQSILFHYLEKEVVDGQENNLNIYYAPDENSPWQQLDTETDLRNNFASASMVGEGIYILISTIEMPPLYPGWNLLAYPDIPNQMLPEVLASIEGAYNSIARCNLDATPTWSLYDPEVSEPYISFVNTLTELKTLHPYWIHVSEFVTPFLSVGNNVALQSSISSSPTCLQPPATFYGPVSLMPGQSPTDVEITAVIDGQDCGQATTVEINSQLVYKIQVWAEDGSGLNDGCGIEGRNVTFTLNGVALENQKIAWDNKEAIFHPLGFGVEIKLFMPIITTP